ncbi:MAG: phosphonate metabolism protein/1,5-bisphosphokinase (PRPP-forming) PhnN [Hyphomicrobiales bacterium]|nr:MAG: phosphonate metabolism protein/1,5-bisphosphokinase (PRPP-forming) PhnN [Hyphomicrobiales bacterium]
MARPGALVLVVGPSGAGKDTLIGAAKAALADDANFVFARRVITRDAVAELEDHDTIDVAGFEAAKARGAFALDWEAHGLCYGVPASIDDDIAEGRTVVMNGSRRMIGDAQARYPRGLVVLITADTAVRARRLAGRGRETEAEIAARLAHEGAPVPDGIETVRIDNSRDLDTAVAALIRALKLA